MPRQAPRWDDLYATASAQAGQFTTSQAAAAGYSPQLLTKHINAGRIVHAGRGLYRLVHFPPGEHEDLVAVWLWSKQSGIFSHETALALHQLSDALPARVHLTLPAQWRQRRLRFPPNVIAYYADVAETDRAWFGAVPVTNPARTILDCVSASSLPDIIEQAVHEGLQRGLFGVDDIAPAISYLALLGKKL
jgi:predicted transcriptional regulator of viral defense system